MLKTKESIYERLNNIGLASPYADVPVLHPHGDKVLGVLNGRGFNPLISESVLYRSLPAAAITNYDGIINARASGNFFDWWEAMTATVGGVTLVWYSGHLAASSVRAAWASTTYVNAGNGGQIYNATTGGAVPMPAAPSQRYLTTCGVSVANITGFSFAMLYDVLWAGRCVISSTATITPTSEPTLTRYFANYPNAYNAAGNMILMVLTATLTFTVAGTLALTYTNQAGTGSQSTGAITYPASGPASPRVVFNQIGTSSTVNPATPFVNLAAGDTGVQKVTTVTIAGLTATSGTADIMIVRPLLVIPYIAASSYIERDSTINMDGLIELVKGSDSQHGCLNWLFFTGGTTATTHSALIRTVSY
jgi:hypothetical protein